MNSCVDHAGDPAAGRWTLMRYGDAFLQDRTRLPLVLALAINILLILITARMTLRDFQNSADEYAQYLSATLFSEGRLAAGSPQFREFFSVTHVVNDGKFYGKYPPGWPMVLAVGILVGLPWIVNPLIGMLTVVVLYRMADVHFGRQTANTASCLLIANPFFVFNSASYFSHSLCLLAITLTSAFFLRCLENPGARRAFAWMGFWIGAAFMTRPYNAIAVLLPLGGYLAYRAIRNPGDRSSLIKGLLISAGPFLFWAALYLLYNYLQTGDPLLQPFSKYNLTDRPFYPRHSRGLVWALENNVLDRLVSLNQWLPLSLFFLAAYLFRKDPQGRCLVLPMFLVFGGQFLAYFWYFGTGGNQYGPRYLYECLSAVTLLAAVMVGRLGRVAPLIVSIVVLLNCRLLWTATAEYGREVACRLELFDVVKKQQLTNAFVFLSTGSGSMPKADLTRNGTRFDGSVLFVRDLGGKNRQLLAAFEDRIGYVYVYDSKTEKGRVVPYGDKPFDDR